MKKKLMLLLACLFVGISLVTAQTQKVTGVVISEEDGQPVVGASVLVKGTTIGTITNVDGNFTLSNVPSSAKTLLISYIGMQTQEAVIKGNIKVLLKPDAKLLDEVVVTAMGVTKSEKSLGYSATVVSGDDIIKSRKSDVLASLSGKVAGVQVSAASSDPGSASSIMIRGVSSLNGNQPLFVVDGVPLVNAANENASGSRLYYSLGNGANMVNPDDVENMTVLKGAAATAMYGSRAANGVIIITTKSGSKKEAINIEVNSGIQFSTVSLLPKMQNEFGQGWSGIKTDNENGSWGPRFDGHPRVYGPIYNNSQLLKNYSPLENNVKDFFETGVMYSNNISLSGGNEKTTYYTSFSNVNDNGILPGSHDTYDKTTLSFRGSHSFKNWFNISSSVNLANQKNKYAMGGQGVTMIDGLYEMPRDISIVDLKDLDNPFNQPGYYFTPYGISNPYYALEYNRNDFKQQKVYGKAQIDITPINGLKLTYRFGFDYSNNENKYATPKLDLIGTPNEGVNQPGSVNVSFQRRYELNHDFMANYSKIFERLNLDLNATAGVNINERSVSSLGAGVSGLSIPTFYDLSNSSSQPSVSEAASKRRLIGIFGDAQLGYKNTIYLNATARNDWSSTLPLTNNSFFYAGLTGSFVFTELLPKNDILSFGKVRVAWGKTGNDANVYLTYPYFAQGYSYNVYSAETSFPIGGINAYKQGATIGSNSLQPEMTTETEIGLNLQFFSGRIGLDAAYYNRTTTNQIFTLGIDPASGFSNMVTNLGEIRNRGLEILLTTTPIQTKQFRWDLNFNFSLNRNKVIKLPEGNKVLINGFSTSNNAVNMYAEEGKPIGTLWTYTKEKDPDGNTVVNPETGLPITVPTLSPTGHDVNHKWEGGISTSFAYAGFTLACDFDIRYGGYMFSRTKDLMAFTGNGVASTYNSRHTYIIPNSVYKVKNADGTFSYKENTTPISSENVANGQENLANGFDGDADLLMDRSFIKLRSLSLSYDFPQKWVSKLCLRNIRLSAVGNNLFAWTPSENTFIDPESTTEGVDLAGKFGELYTNPSSRKIGFNLQVKF